MKEAIENLQKSFELSSQQIDDVVNPLEVAALFESENVSYVLCSVTTRAQLEQLWMSILSLEVLIFNVRPRSFIMPMRNSNIMIKFTMLHMTLKIRTQKSREN